MSLLWRTTKATIISVPVLWLVWIVLFPPQNRHQFDETIGWLILLTLFLGIPLFLVILFFNAIFNRPADATPHVEARKSPIWFAIIGAILAGIASAFIDGIIFEVWLIFTGIGALLGFIAGKTR